MSRNFRRLLPDTFTINDSRTVAPAALFDLLTGLFNRERAAQPGNTYLAYHGSPASIYHHLLTFGWYLPSLPSGGTVLDWGCNHAPDMCCVRHVYGDAVERHGCDFHDGTLYPVFFEEASLEYRQLTDHIRLPYDTGMFEAVVASGVLEHAAIDNASLQELYRILKPEGVLVITYLPNALSVEEWRFEHIRRRDFHMRRYHDGAFRQQLKHNGFFPVRWGYQSVFWERRLASVGLRNQHRISRLFYRIFPVHYITGCLQTIAIKKASM